MATTEWAGDRRASTRAVVVWDALESFLVGDPLDVLDIGGGTGVSAVRLAERGHRVSVVDPSPDGLAALDQRAREVGVEVAAHQGEVSTLLETVEPASADLVLCHGVLEVVTDPVDALRTIGEVLRPGGTVSLLAGQRSAAVLARAMAGHLDEAAELLDDTSPVGHSGRRFTRGELESVLSEAGFTASSVHGVRVFTDLVPGGLLDEPGAAEALIDLERTVSQRPDYLPLATQLHVLAQRG